MSRAMRRLARSSARPAETRRTIWLPSPVVAAVAAAVVLALTPEPAHAGGQGEGGRIAFSSDVSGIDQLYTMNPDGSDVVRLTNAPESIDHWPSWSPDGSEIAFRRILPDGNRDVFVIRSDGTGLRRLTSAPASDSHPDWTPDGRIVFHSNRNDPNPSTCISVDVCHFDLFIMDADGSNLRQLTTSTASDHYPAVSPDGTMLAFGSTRSGSNALWVVAIDGYGATQLTPDAMRAGAPEWSPNGKQILFSNNACAGCPASDLFVMKSEPGSRIKQLTHSFGNNINADWSPDGERIVFQHSGSTPPPFPTDILTINPNGKDLTNLTDTPALTELTPSWGPDRPTTGT